MPSPRSYRSKLEVLRDFLRAAQEPAPKTRIIGAANLNPLSFGKYLRLCTEHDLITSVAGGYVTTPRASPLLQAIDGVMTKTTELENALVTLGRSTVPSLGANGGGSRPFRQVLRHAWNEIALQAPEPPNGHGASSIVLPGTVGSRGVPARAARRPLAQKAGGRRSSTLRSRPRRSRGRRRGSRQGRTSGRRRLPGR